ncbi:hypothetical protein Cgig2_018080 [Carnegiea gigantea]|uniref:Uncharacterized protein n=1 Tax=Carnegiea gigantea TaxID=171969 RepID=A0A9Q1Q949_9CARY|nr:hypothetical protein Cgig2_018080 [Carnegiea gigantea]
MAHLSRSGPVEVGWPVPVSGGSSKAGPGHPSGGLGSGLLACHAGLSCWRLPLSTGLGQGDGTSDGVMDRCCRLERGGSVLGPLLAGTKWRNPRLHRAMAASSDISRAIGFDSNLTEKRSKLGLTTMERHRAAKKIASESKGADVFFSIPDVKKKERVRALLGDI